MDLPKSVISSRSRTWRMVSASLRTSVSTGALSSNSAARMRAKPLVLGCVLSVSTHLIASYVRTNKLPRRVTALRTTPGVEGAVTLASSPLSLLDDRCK